MRNLMSRFGILGLLAIAMIVSGCLIISGTFVIVEPFAFTSETGFYAYDVDITDEEDWEDHKDDIDNIDLVGFEMWFTNNEVSDVTFNVYIDEVKAPEYDNYDDVDANATKILDDLTLPASSPNTHLTYGSSFKYLMNVDALKTMVELGSFRFYGVSSGGTDNEFIIDSGKVIVTFTAHGS